MSRDLDKKTSKDHMETAIRMLQEANITPVRHFSPYAEDGYYKEGSGLQRFWDEAGRMYAFLFDLKGSLIWKSF